MNHLTCKLAALTLTIALLSGCSTFNPSADVEDPEQKALEIVPFEVPIRPLDLSEYQDPDYKVVTTQDGDKMIAMTEEQHSRFLEILVELREHIRVQRQTIDEIQLYYQSTTPSE